MSGFRPGEQGTQQLAGLGDELADARDGGLRHRRGFVDLGHHLLGVDHGVEGGVQPRERHHVFGVVGAALHGREAKQVVRHPGRRVDRCQAGVPCDDACVAGASSRRYVSE